jgi:N-acetylmuramoyl-L-alanine amidase
MRPHVAVDIGHTLAVPGAISARGRPEFGFNRALAEQLAAALAARGAEVQLVNADGLAENLALRSRAAAGARLLFSVHHDSVQPHYLSSWVHEGVERRYSDRHAGFSLFVSRRNPMAASSLACASAVGASLRAAGFAPSLYHAERIAGESKPLADRANGVHYYDNLIILKSATAPAVLFEAGVIVNRDEELQLLDGERRARMAAAVATGILSCTTRPGRDAPSRSL